MAQPQDQPTEVAWYDQVPPVLWPVPVAELPALLGKRVDLIGTKVVVGETRVGFWSYDQRAASNVHRYQGRDCIGVIPEVDWYRQQRDPSYRVTPRPVPVDEVFVEVTVPMDAHASPTAPDQSDLRPACRSVSLVERADNPKVRWPRPANQESLVTGARCWVLTPYGVLCGYRALGEPRRAEVGTIDWSRGLEGLDVPSVSTVIPLYREWDWYRWRDTGRRDGVTSVLIEARLVFLE